MRIKTFLLLGALFLAKSLTAYNGNLPLLTNSEGNIPIAGGCNFLPPTDVDIAGAGSTWIFVTWTPPTVIPPSYRLKTYETSSGILVDVRDVPGSFTSTRVTGLNPATTYTVYIYALCADGTESEYNGSDTGTTIILDLVVTGFSNEGTTPSCGVYTPNAYCLFDQNATQGTVFRIINLEQPSLTRKFLVTKTGAAHFSVSIRSSENNSNYTFQCVGVTGAYSTPNCYNALKIAIFYDGTLIGTFDVSEVPEGKSTFGHLTCLDDLMKYQIQRMGAGPGFAGSAEDRGEFDQTILVTAPNFSISPNPFSDHLDVQLNLADEKTSVALNLYDLQGRLVVAKNCEGGQQTQTLPTETLLPGMYFLHVEAAGETRVVKVVKTQ